MYHIFVSHPYVNDSDCARLFWTGETGKNLIETSISVRCFAKKIDLRMMLKIDLEKIRNENISNEWNVCAPAKMKRERKKKKNNRQYVAIWLDATHSLIWTEISYKIN